MLDNRLKVLLPCLISKSHSAFVTKRQIIDNILVAYEVINFLKMKSKGNQGFMSLKLDMSKAHDRVEWGYLEGILIVLGFSINFFNLIMQCMKMASFSVLVNGVPKEPIIPSRGICQGDSFSLYIFLLCIEGLVNLLNYSLMEKSLKGISVCQGAPIINHLLFADDSLIFWEATIEASNSLLKILDEYAHAFSQCINIDKTSMVFSRNVKDVDKSQISTMWSYCEMKQCEKYLGLLPIVGHSKKKAFFEIKTRLWQCHQTWKGKLLS